MYLAELFKAWAQSNKLDGRYTRRYRSGRTGGPVEATQLHRQLLHAQETLTHNPNNREAAGRVVRLQRALASTAAKEKQTQEA